MLDWLFDKLDDARWFLADTWPCIVAAILVYTALAYCGCAIGNAIKPIVQDIHVIAEALHAEEVSE